MVRTSASLKPRAYEFGRGRAGDRERDRKRADEALQKALKVTKVANESASADTRLPGVWVGVRSLLARLRAKSRRFFSPSRGYSSAQLRLCPAALRPTHLGAGVQAVG